MGDTNDNIISPRCVLTIT